MRGENKGVENKAKTEKKHGVLDESRGHGVCTGCEVKEDAIIISVCKYVQWVVSSVTEVLTLGTCAG